MTDGLGFCVRCGLEIAEDEGIVADVVRLVSLGRMARHGGSGKIAALAHPLSPMFLPESADGYGSTMRCASALARHRIYDLIFHVQYPDRCLNRIQIRSLSKRR